MNSRLKGSAAVCTQLALPLWGIVLAVEILLIFLGKLLPVGFDAAAIAGAYVIGRIVYPLHTRLSAAASCQRMLQIKAFAIHSIVTSFSMAAVNGVLYGVLSAAMKKPPALLIISGYYQIKPPALPLLILINILWSGTLTAAVYMFGYADGAASSRMKNVSVVYIIAGLATILFGGMFLGIMPFVNAANSLINTASDILIPLHRTVFSSSAVSLVMWLLLAFVGYLAHRKRSFAFCANDGKR